jgi:hypothetical protein
MQVVEKGSVGIAGPATALRTTLPAGARQGFLEKLGWAAYGVALMAALLHIAPYWHSYVRTPPGWAFTWNIYDSPDFIQYRAWMRLSQRTGILVPDHFTSEPNPPHLPVLLYYVFGQVARATGQEPEAVMAFAGSLFAFAMAVLLFATVRLFLRSAYRTWWVFLIILLGGGVGAYMKLLGRFDAVRQNFITGRLIVEPIFNPKTLLFEDYRGHYLFATLFDTHHLLNWLAATLAVLALYFALKRFSLARVALVAGLYGLATFLHIYEAATLSMITAAVAIFCWRKGLLARRDWISLAAGPVAAGISLYLLMSLQRSSGLPFPPWRATGIFLAIVVVAYPLAWLLIAWGVAAFWRNARLEECFLLGWAGGCTALLLSAPFYPYPDRGAMTLQIPLYIIAGMIYFARRTSVTRWGAVAAIALTIASPAWLVLKWVTSDPFRPDEPHVYTSQAHREIIGSLASRATANDILVADPNEMLWIAPEYMGKHYCAHFFLTANYEQKLVKVAEFFGAGPQDQAAFLQRERIRFVYAGQEKNPEKLAQVPGLTIVKATPIGSLFEYRRASGAGIPDDGGEARSDSPVAALPRGIPQ